MRILGIDIGSTSVKAVELDSAFGRFEIHEHHEAKIEPGAHPGEVLQQLIASLPKPPDRVAVALRTGQVTFRNLQLPTRERKAIMAGVRFELEDDLPFDLDQSVHDYSVLSQSGPGSQVHVAATLRTYVQSLVDLCAAGGADPDLVTTEAWSYRTLLNRVLAPAAQERPVLLAQIGHERTILYVHWKGLPVVAREIPWGGRDLTNAICVKYAVPLDQAEAAKLDHGFVLPPSQREQATAEQREFSDALREPLIELIRAIRQAGLTCKNVTHENLATLYLSGGTSLLPGLGRMLEEELKLPTHTLQAMSAIAPSGVTYSEQTDAAFVQAIASALCLVGADRSAAINLRRGPLVKQGRSRDLNLATLRGPVAGAAIVLFSFVLSTVFQGYVYKARLKDLDSQLEKSVRSFFGQLSSSALRTYMASTSSLKSAINKELTKQRELAKLLGPNPHSPLDYLKELSSGVPRDTIVDMTQYQVGAAATPYSPTADSTVSLTFLVPNQSVAEKVAEALGRRMTGIQRSRLEEVSSPDGTSKRWRVTFSGKPTEDAYGK